MGRRHDMSYPEYFNERWPSARLGRYWKRRLSKARRKYARMLIKFGRGQEPAGLEARVNYKTW